MPKLKITSHYCECGCKGVAVSCGNIDYWIHDNLAGYVRLFQGHGFSGLPLSVYSTYENALDAARRAIERDVERLDFFEAQPTVAPSVIRAVEDEIIRLASIEDKLRSAAVKQMLVELRQFIETQRKYGGVK